LRINFNKNDLEISGMAGMGPAAWINEGHRVKMHPPLPDHVDHIIDHIEEHLRTSHLDFVRRRHPENDSEEELVQVEIPLKYLLPLLAGKTYVRGERSGRYDAEPALAESGHADLRHSEDQ
jgi:hypothetical protein